jgi:predicted DNA-binding transcriptional regulator YafY
MWNFTDVRQLALHRMRAAMILEEQSCRPDGFSLDGYIAGGGFGYPESGETIRLEALFSQPAAVHLAECPLSDDQQILPQDAETVPLCATVLDTKELRWWLLGFGDQVTVQSPPALRDSMCVTAKNMAAQYMTLAPSAA